MIDSKVERKLGQTNEIIQHYFIQILFCNPAVIVTQRNLTELRQTYMHEMYISQSVSAVIFAGDRASLKLCRSSVCSSIQSYVTRMHDIRDGITTSFVSIIITSFITSFITDYCQTHALFTQTSSGAIQTAACTVDPIDACGTRMVFI